MQYLGYPIINDVKYGGTFIGNYVIKNIYPEIWEKKDSFEPVKFNDLYDDSKDDKSFKC